MTPDELTDLEEIKRVKYAYLRCLDQKDWDGMAEILCDDASAAYERQVNELVTADDDMAAYVTNLEERFDDEDEEIELPTGDELMREVENFLRDQGD